MDDFEIVTVEEAPSPAPIPNGRPYEEVVNANTPAKTFMINGIHYYIKNLVDRMPVQTAMVAHGGCVTCIARARKFYGLLGPTPDKCNSTPVFLKNIRSKEDGWSADTELGSFFNVRDKCVAVNKKKTNLKFFLVEEGCFPPVNEGVNEKDEPFQHVTIFPDNYTAPELVTKYKKLLEENITIIQPRLEKLCEIHAYDSVNIIVKKLYRLERPDHWRGVLDWVMGVQKKWMELGKGKISERIMCFKDFPKDYKIHLAVFALTTGRFEDDGITVVHKDYKQSANIIDFITGEIESVLREMDARSDPDNYMVSQLSRNIAKHKVSSKHRISLVWDGQFTDDLDIHLRWYKKGNCGELNYIHEIYYNSKSWKCENYETRLDFDANAGTPEAEPAENITCAPFGLYQVWVNNFRRRTHNKDIPFTIIIHQEGNKDIIIERTWPPDRNSGDLMKIVEHSFTEVSNPNLVMSTKAASRAKVVSEEWNKYFGSPTSHVPNLQDLDIPMYVWEKKDRGFSPNLNFMDLANDSIYKKENPSSRKLYLSEREENKIPTVLSDLLKYMSSGSHTLEIYPRSYAPGYVTEIKTNETVMKTKYSLNHYKNKGHIPNKPSENGTTRFNDSWFKNGSSATGTEEVDCIVQFGNNWFMVIKNTRLPINDPDFPLCGGFHPGKLLPTFHNNHNYQWTFCNTQIIPTTNENEGTPLIGSFLVSNEIELILNGNKIKVKVE